MSTQAEHDAAHPGHYCGNCPKVLRQLESLAMSRDAYARARAGLWGWLRGFGRKALR